MDMHNPETRASEFAALLAEPEGRRSFFDAVSSVSDAALGRQGWCYNIEKVAALSACIDSYKYASQQMRSAQRFTDRLKLHEYCVRQLTFEAPVLEFGVWGGASINHLARLLPLATVYGFDSFEGLPEEWTSASEVGAFSRGGHLPEVRENVELVAGWFDRSLPAFLDSHPFGRISLLHIDCDIYSSTQTVFSLLYQRIVPGTIIVFDEYFNYPTWERHEHRAFQEYVSFRQVRYEYIGLVPDNMQVAVRILSC